MTAYEIPLDLIDDDEMAIGAEADGQLEPWGELGRTPAAPQVLLDADSRWEWAAERTERLLPEVLDMLGDQLTLPPDLKVVLCGRRRLALELGRRTAETQAGYIGLRYRLLLPWHVVKALAVSDRAVWANDAGEVDVLVNVRRAEDGDREYGAVLAAALVLAALMASYSRAMHLRTWTYPGARSRYDASEPVLHDLRLALVGAEQQAAAAAAGEWRDRHDWAGPAIERAREIMRTFGRAEHVVTAEERAQDYAAHTVYAIYSGEREPAEADVNALYRLRARIAEHGTAPSGEGEQLAADRRARLAAAASTDFQALARCRQDGDEHGHEAKVADEFGRALYEFDVAHGTGRGLRPVDDRFWTATRAWRSYTRQEWGADHAAATAPGAGQ